ncbi:MAG: hypothetical protein HOB07_00650 [Chloroflexi bacterium]|nr:hypothetical protein [Chloroflexota bacterium]
MTLLSGPSRLTTGWDGEFAEDPSAVPVDIYLRGVRYPGEAVFTEFWNARWGVGPDEGAMFRIVFLGTSGPVSADDIDDDRIVVIAPSGEMSPELRPVAREAAALKETRAGYAISADPALSQLAHAIELREGELATKVADSMGRRWADGSVITRGDGPDLTALLPTLEHSGPDTWLEALGTWVIGRDAKSDLPQSTEPLTDELIADIFDLVAERNQEPPLQASAAAIALGLGGTASSQVSRFKIGLDTLLESVGESDGTARLTTAGTASGLAVRSLITTSLRMPLELGALYLVDYIRRRDAEAVLIPVIDAGFPERINRDTLPDMTWDPRLLQRLFVVRSATPGDWNAALPYLSAVYPAATRMSNVSDAPLSADVSADREEFAAGEFMEELRSQASRVSFTASVVTRVEQLIGIKSNWDLGRLSDVMGASSWSEFAELARDAYDNARGFRVALARERTARGLSMRSHDIEQTVAYLDAAEFGSEHRSLQLEARALRARFGADLINDSDGLWPALRNGFDQWRGDYRRTYISMHAARRAQDEERQQRMSRAIVQVAAIEGFGRIPELGPAQGRDLTQRYDELALRLEPCPFLEHDISLINHPSCENCGVSLSSPMERSDIDGYLFELESVLSSYNRRLSSVAVREALAGRQPDQLSKLLELRDAADLSALSEHLGADVIDFLREFLAASE